MSTTALTIVAVVSWLLLFFGIFVYDRLHRRLVTLQVQQDYLLRTVQSIAERLEAVPSDDALTLELIQLIHDGKTYEALTSYRNIKGVTYHEAKAYIDSLTQPN